MRDQACPLVWRRRATRRCYRHGNHRHAAIVHCSNLLCQQSDLVAVLPRMRHKGSGGGRIARESVPAKIDARCEYQALVTELAPICEGNGLRRGIDGRSSNEFRADTCCRNVIVAKILKLEIAQARNCRIAHWACRESAISLDEGHSHARIRALERASTGCPAESTTHNDNARIAVLCDRRHWKNGGRGRHCSPDEVAPRYAILFHMRMSW